jgi:cytoskeletal protein CcmA (bactofilin family)
VRSSGVTELPSFTGKKQEAGKPVHCLKCGRTHHVSQKAQSTICPGCYAPIELIDVNITGPSSRAVDTRGLLKIAAKGSLSNPWIICGSARIEGAFNGHLRCEGEVRLNMQKPCTGRITADSILVEKRAAIECSQPLEADRITIQGTLRAPIHCNGIIQILNGGCLEGPVTSRAMVVEKGGIHFGECRIQPPAVVEPSVGNTQLEGATSTSEA